MRNYFPRYGLFTKSVQNLKKFCTGLFNGGVWLVASGGEARGERLEARGGEGDGMIF